MWNKIQNVGAHLRVRPKQTGQTHGSVPTNGSSFIIHHSSFILAFLLSLSLSHTALAVQNTATGTIGGILGTLTSSGTVTLTVKQLILNKEVRDVNGIFLGSNVNVAEGATVWFVLYVNNVADSTLSDTQLQDAVPSGVGNFTVQELAPGAHAQAIDIAAVPQGQESKKISDNWGGAWIGVTDASGDNVNAVNSGEYVAGTQTFSFGTNATPTIIPANTLRAYRIKVIVN